ncbi:uncharacterized protein LOC118510816 [Anopheles stephensi]|uniref:uncharacterized protein LOC118510816 n=1 Tax=Anopheles stephensi TaxID=30069 RepID=UPI0016587327|nr:uncharacterized protein LOC118510816 [Anopheles stephensi]
MEVFIVLLLALGAFYPSATVLAQQNQLPQDPEIPEQQDQSVQSVQSIQSIHKITRHASTGPIADSTTPMSPEGQTSANGDAPTTPAQSAEQKATTPAPSNPTDDAGPADPTHDNPDANNPSATPSAPVPIVLNMNVMVVGETPYEYSEFETEKLPELYLIEKLQNILDPNRRNAQHSKSHKVEDIMRVTPPLVTQPVLWDDEDDGFPGRKHRTTSKDCLFC